MKQYLELLERIMGPEGNTRGDRTGTGTRSVFGHQMRFDLTAGFPMVTTKKLHLRSIIHELLWFIRGSTNNEELRAEKVSIWDEWALPEDVYDEVPLPLEERAHRLSMKLDIVRPEINKMLQQADAKQKSSPDWNGDPQQGGKLLLAEHGIPETVQIPRYKKGELGPIYGRQWRSWRGPRGAVVDQLAEVIEGLKTKPWSRRHIVTAWNPVDLPDESISPQENVKQGRMALAACHCLFQFYVTAMTYDERVAEYEKLHGYGATDALQLVPTEEERMEIMTRDGVPDKKLSCQLYQRSADTFLGVPYNITSYALLTHMVAQVCGMGVGEFVWVGGDVHIYSNHFDQVREQLSREPFPLPKLRLNPAIKNIDDFKFEDIEVIGYQSHPAIKAPISV